MSDWDIRDLEKLQKAQENMMRRVPVFLGSALVIIGLIWLATGFYVVSPGEQGVVRQFGKETNKTNPGLHYHLPYPIQRVNVVSVERVRRAEIGFRTLRRGSETFVQRAPREALMLTGDANIVEAQVIVQYRIKDPSKYLFRLRDPEQNLRAATEVALRAAVGNSTIDDVLTVGRAKVQAETLTFLQKLLDEYNSGLFITEVRLQVVDPPEQVKDAFHEVVRAKEDREKLINQAKGYKEDVIPKARGKAQEILRAAEAYKTERVLKAKGEANRFVALLKEYAQSKEVTRDRLYLEALEVILPQTKKLVVTTEQGVLPLISLSASQPVPLSEHLQKIRKRQP